MQNRDCDNCVWSTRSGGCKKWKCEGTQTVADIRKAERDKVADEIRADVIEERASLLAFICKKYDIPLVDMNCTVDEWEQLKEQKK